MIKENRKNYVWNSIGLTFNAFISLIYLIIITRINGIELAGIFSFLFTLSLIFYNIGLYGGKVYQVSDIKGEFSNQQYFSAKHVTNFVSMVITIFYCIINKFNVLNFSILFLLMLIRVLESYSDTIYGVFQKNDKLEYAGKSQFYKAIFSVIIFTIIDLISLNIIFSLFGALFFGLLIFIFYDLKKLRNYEKIKIKLDFKSSKKILFVMRYMCLFSLITLVITNLPRFIVNDMLNEDYQGYFSIIIMLPTAVCLLGQFIIQPEILNLSKLFFNQRKKEINGKIKKILLIVFGLSLFCMICSYMFGPFFLKLIYGLNFSEYRLVLIIVVIGGMFNIMATICSSMLTIMRKTKEQFYLYVIVLIISMIICPIIIKLNKFYGPYFAYLVIMILEFILFYASYKKFIRK